MDGWKWLALISLLGVNSQACADVLVGPTYYQNAVASSTFNSSGSYPVTNLFDNDTATQWAIAGATGSGTPLNPQGQGQGWIKFNLDQAYTIDKLIFAARSTDPTTDGLTSLKVWYGTSAFSVDVTSASSTSAFLTSNPTPSFTQTGGFTTTNSEYSLGGPVLAQYFVAQFFEASPSVNSNLGGATFLVNAVPEPGTMLLGGIAAVCGGGGVWWKRRKKGEKPEAAQAKTV